MKVKIRIKGKAVFKPLDFNPTKIHIFNKMVDFENKSECSFLYNTDFDEMIIEDD